MPLLTTLNPFTLKGYAYRLKFIGNDASSVYQSILEATGASRSDDRYRMLCSEVAICGSRSLINRGHLMILSRGIELKRNMYEFVYLLKLEQGYNAEEIYHILYPPEYQYTASQFDELRKRVNVAYASIDTASHVERYYDIDALRGVLVSLKVEGFGCEEAYAELIRMFPNYTDMTRDEVSRVISNCATGREYLQQSVPEHAQLINLPWHILTKILQSMDIPSRIHLRNTCHFFKRRVENQQIHQSYLSIHNAYDLIRIQTDGCLFEWKRLRIGYMVLFNETKMFKNRNEKALMRKEAKKFIEGMCKLSNVTFETFCYYEEPDLEKLLIRTGGLEELAIELIPSFKNLRARNVIIHSDSKYNAVSALESMDPNYVHFISLRFHEPVKDVPYSMSLREQWDRADSFNMNQPIKETPKSFCKYFGHFNFTVFAVLSFTMKHFVEIINDARKHSPRLRSRIIYCNMSSRVFAPISGLSRRDIRNGVPFKSPIIPYEEPYVGKSLQFYMTRKYFAIRGPCFDPSEIPNDVDMY